MDNLNQNAGDSNQSGLENGTDQSQAPQPIDITDDTLIRVAGQKDPVKYGELYKNLQGDYTKKSQAVADAERKLAEQRSGWDKERSAQETYLKSLAAQLLQRQSQGQQGRGGDYRSKLAAKQYLSGTDAAEMFDQVGGGLSTVVQAITERDQVITALYQKLQTLEQTVNTLGGVHTNQSFEQKIGGWVKQLGLPEEATQLAKEIYLAYEGDDLDNEFPNILKERWDTTVNLINQINQKKVDAARQSPFKLAGRGGSGTAGQNIGLKGNESAKDTAEKLWDAMHAGG